MKILKINKDSVQVELSKKDVETIKSGLGWGYNETDSQDYHTLEEEFEELLTKMEK